MWAQNREVIKKSHIRHVDNLLTFLCAPAARAVRMRSVRDPTPNARTLPWPMCTHTRQSQAQLPHGYNTATPQQRLDLYHTGHAFFFRDYEELQRVGMTDACAFELFVLSVDSLSFSEWIWIACGRLLIHNPISTNEKTNTHNIASTENLQRLMKPVEENCESQRNRKRRLKILEMKNFQEFRM